MIVMFFCIISRENAHTRILKKFDDLSCDDVNPLKHDRASGLVLSAGVASFLCFSSCPLRTSRVITFGRLPKAHFLDHVIDSFSGVYSIFCN